MLNICYKFVTFLLRKIFPGRFFQELEASNYFAGLPEFTIYVKFYHKLESWKFLEKLGEAGMGLGAGRAGRELEPPGELEKFVKFYISWKFMRVKYMYKYSTSWKLEALTARQAGNFKIIKFIFI